MLQSRVPAGGLLAARALAVFVVSSLALGARGQDPPECEPVPVDPAPEGVVLPSPDCNRNGVIDACDIHRGTSFDDDQDGIPDECFVLPPECLVPAEQVGAERLDCNRNGILDPCDIRLGTSQDVDQDGLPDECKTAIDDPVRLYAEVKTSAAALEAAGFLPRKTLDFLDDNREALEADLQLLIDAIAVTEFTSAAPPDIDLGGGASGGVIDGGFVFAISSQGHFVGAFYPQAVWNDGADPCHRAISGHTYAGGVISGSCSSVQVGAAFTESCGPTPVCPVLTVDCAAIQVQCQQVFGTTINQFNTPLEVLCAPCDVRTQVPGDCNGDGGVELSDAICFLGHLFLATPQSLTCGDGRTTHPSNKALLDWNGDARLDIADPISSLTWLFNGGPGHILGHQCAAIPECPRDCSG
jgi:hypothetical protein